MRTVQVPEGADRQRERAAWLALGSVDGLGPASIWAMVEAAGSALAAWESGSASAPPRARRALQAARSRLDPARLMEEAEAGGVRVLTPVDAGYPSPLLDLHDPPPVLHARGTWQPVSGGLRVSVVGSRRATPYGLTIAERLARDLADLGAVVVSGLARGVDGAAHRGSLAGGGPTVAVLGCGLDRDYPPEHARLRRQVEENGVVLSEYPRGTAPEPWRFPARNRILAALGHAVVVVQAAARSGALITAGLALEIGREVLAVPGPVGPEQSEGALQLLSEGAGVARNAWDILHALGLDPAPPRAERALGGDAGRVLRALGSEGAGVDAVVERTGLRPGPAAAMLVRLEVEGRVRRLPEGLYIALDDRPGG